MWNRKKIEEKKTEKEEKIVIIEAEQEVDLVLEALLKDLTVASLIEFDVQNTNESNNDLDFTKHLILEKNYLKGLLQNDQSKNFITCWNQFLHVVTSLDKILPKQFKENGFFLKLKEIFENEKYINNFQTITRQSSILEFTNQWKELTPLASTIQKNISPNNKFTTNQRAFKDFFEKHPNKTIKGSEFLFEWILKVKQSTEMNSIVNLMQENRNKTLIELKEELENIEKNISQQKIESNHLKKQLNEQRQKVEEKTQMLDEKISQLNIKDNELSGKIELLNIKELELQNKGQEAIKITGDLKNIKEELDRSQKQWKKETEEYNKKYETQEKQRKELEEKLEKFGSEVSLKEHKLLEINKLLDEKIKHNDLLQNNLMKSTKTNSKLNTTNKFLLEENTNLNKTLLEQSTRLEQFEKSYNQSTNNSNNGHFFSNATLNEINSFIPKSKVSIEKQERTFETEQEKCKILLTPLQFQLIEALRNEIKNTQISTQTTFSTAYSADDLRWAIVEVMRAPVGGAKESFENSEEYKKLKNIFSIKEVLNGNYPDSLETVAENYKKKMSVDSKKRNNEKQTVIELRMVNRGQSIINIIKAGIYMQHPQGLNLDSLNNRFDFLKKANTIEGCPSYTAINKNNKTGEPSIDLYIKKSDIWLDIKNPLVLREPIKIITFEEKTELN